MKKRTLLSVLMMSAFLIVSSCASTSKFDKDMTNELGAVLLSDNVDLSTMVNAAKYGIKKAGLELEKEEKKDEGTIILVGKLGSSWQSWGQHVKITLKKSAVEAKAFYVSKARIAMNVTEDTDAIKNNIKTYMENYLVATKEGIEL